MSLLVQPEALGKLAKLVLLLFFDVDGEVVAAARAIGRTLASEGYDWHDLANIVMRPSQSPVLSPSAVGECLRRPEQMSSKERHFLASIRRQTKPSQRQEDWLADIVERVRS